MSRTKSESSMSYSIKTRVYQTNTNAYFHVVEKASGTLPTVAPGAIRMVS